MSDKLYTQADLRDAYTEGVADTISANAGRFNNKPLTPENPYLIKPEGQSNGS